MADFSFPEILSSRVSVSSVALPLNAEARGELERSGIRLPEALSRAIEKRQSEYLGGRLCAWRALTQAGVPSDVASRIAVGEDRSPGWPAGWVGSITHCDGFAAAAVGPASELGGIGIDTELVMSPRTATEVRSSILTPGDLALLSKLGELGVGLNEEQFVTLVFSAKESLYKCLRPKVGVFFGFQDAKVAGVSPGTIQLEVLKPLGGLVPAGRVLEGRFEVSQGRISTAFECPTY